MGTELVPLLAARPEVKQVVVYDNLSRNNYNLFLGSPFAQFQKVRFVAGDLLDTRKLRKTLEGVDVVYHLAAMVTTPFANSDSHNFEQVNHWGTAELVYAIEEQPSVKQLVFASSTSVFGSADQEVDEDQTPRPHTIYGTSKQRAEEHVERLKEKISTYVLRCGNVYGYSKSMRFDAVVNRFMFDANFNGRINIHGNGRQYRAFIHIDALAGLLSQLPFAQVPSGTYTVANQNMSVLEVVEGIKEIYPALEFIFINQHLNLHNLKVNVQSQLRQYLDYQSPQSFTEQLRAFKQKFSFINA